MARNARKESVESFGVTLRTGASLVGRDRLLSAEWLDRASFVRLSPHAQLLLLLVFTKCDDYGRAPASPLVLAGLFPGRPEIASELPRLLTELEDCGEVRVYRTRGQEFLTVTAWDDLVNPKRFARGRQRYPQPPLDKIGAQANLDFAATHDKNGPSETSRTRPHLVKPSSL